MTDVFEHRVEKLEPKEDKKKSSAAVKKSNDTKSTKNQKQADSALSVIEFSEDFFVKHMPVKKHCILYGKCSHPTGKRKDLREKKRILSHMG